LARRASLEYCVRIDVARDYVSRVRARFVQLASEVGSKLPPALARRERENIDAIVAFLDRALKAIDRLREALCGERVDEAEAEEGLSSLYRILVSASSLPVPSQVRAAIDDAYMAAREVLRRGSAA
jgi:hypothetical protein